MWLLLPGPSVRGRLAGVTVVSAAAAVSLRNPMYCAVWFAMTLLGTAGLFLFGGAQFLAVATVVVYAGAILVTFLFVLMLAEPSGRAAYDRMSWESLLSAVAGVVLIGILSTTAGSVLRLESESSGAVSITQTERAAGILADDHVASLGRQMFGPHLIAVQVGGVLLLAALIGAAAIVAGGETRNTVEGDSEDGAPSA